MDMTKTYIRGMILGFLITIIPLIWCFIVFIFRLCLMEALLPLLLLLLIPLLLMIRNRLRDHKETKLKHKKCRSELIDLRSCFTTHRMALQNAVIWFNKNAEDHRNKNTKVDVDKYRDNVNKAKYLQDILDTNGYKLKISEDVYYSNNIEIRDSLPLIEAISEWEGKHGSLTDIAPEKFESFCKTMSIAAVVSISRATKINSVEKDKC